MIVEKLRQHDGREDLHELGRLKLKRPHVNPRLHVRGEAAEDQQIQQQDDAESIEERRDVEEDVVVDEEAEQHQHQADGEPEKLFLEDAEAGIVEVRGAVDEQTADRGDHEGRAEEVEVEFR